MAETFDTTRDDVRGMVGVYHGEDEFAQALEVNLRRGFAVAAMTTRYSHPQRKTDYHIVWVRD